MTACRKMESTDSGVILIEVLVALTILSVGIVAALNLVQASRRAVSRAERMMQASWLLDEVLAREVHREGVGPTAGSDGVFKWSTNRESWPPDSVDASWPSVPLELLTATVVWEDRGKQVSIDAVELCTVPQTGQ